ncbi:MAG: hypothetical protein AAF598_19790 [Bacteroidota bacterium]
MRYPSSKSFILTLSLVVSLCSSFKLNGELYCNQFSLNQMSELVIYNKPYGKILPYFKHLDNLLMDKKMLFTILDRIIERNRNDQIINGNLAQALTDVQKFRDLLAEYEEATETQGQNKQALKSELEIYFKALKLHAKGILEAERTIARQQAHFPELFEKINTLKNLNGQTLPVYVHAHEQLPLSGDARSCYHALTLMGEANGQLSSSLPEIKERFPRLQVHHNAISIHIEFGEMGEVLSHEFGHVYYLANHWQRYKGFRMKKGKKYVQGGHGIDDPNGQWASSAERGKWPESKQETDEELLSQHIQ